MQASGGPGSGPALPLVSHMTFLGLSFLFYRMEIIIIPQRGIFVVF